MMQIGTGLFVQGRAAAAGGGAAPANVTPPAITGSAVQGATLAGSPGTWTGSPAPTLAWQWRAAGAAIPGATGPTLVLGGAEVGAAITLAVTATNAGGSAGAVSAPTAAAAPSLAALAPAPAARWHPQFSSVTTAAGRVTAASDLMGLAGATEGAAGNGPQALTDAHGRAFWRFQQAEFLNVASTLAFDNRNVTVVFVGRIHRTEPSNPVFSGGNLAAGTQLSGSGMLSAGAASNGMPILGSAGRSGSLDAVNAPWMVAGAQMQVLAAASRTTAAGGTSLWVNARRAAVGQNTINRPVLTGAEIGRSPTSTDNLGLFDLYELAVWTGALTNAEGDALAAALVAHYAIPAVQHQIVLEGDSITQGTGTVKSGATSGMVLAEPGAGRVPPGWRVVNTGVSGATLADVTARRDAATGWGAMAVPGGENVVAVEIGRNDMGPVGGNLTPAQHYANLVAWLTQATTGVLPRGWRARVLANIAGANDFTTNKIAPFRALLRDPAFLTDTQSGPGQAWEGRVTLVSTDLIEDGPGNLVFLTAADAADPVYYQGDVTHPGPLGAHLRVTGGTTPANGIAAGL